MPTIINPVLKGFHPDPSICRVGDDFYIATSTFEWYPGVTIHHSRDLVNWELVARPLNRKSQLSMEGEQASAGVWAPCLSYSDGQFWLIYTDVKGWTGIRPGFNSGFKDSHNYLVTCDTVTGDWSDPIYMNSSGFDPSLFHDEDGRKWFVNMIWDYRPHRNNFAGIVLQEYSHDQKCLIGPVKNIFKGTEIALTEAPHLYRRGEYYYLMTAEGGTTYEHAVTLARSRSLEGPYELHPHNPLLSSVKDRDIVRKGLASESVETVYEGLYPGLQKAGHGSMVPWDGDEWILAHLCGRPLPGTLYCPLGRETALQKLIWSEDGWPYPVQMGPQSVVTFSDRDGTYRGTSPEVPVNWREDFDEDIWDLQLQSVRQRADASYDMKARKGWIRLHGAESPTSVFRQTLLARRVTAFKWEAETLIDFHPEDFQSMAGLVLRYDENTQLYLRLSAEEGVRTLGILSYDREHLSMPLGEEEIRVPDRPIYLKAVMESDSIQFFYSGDGKRFEPIGPSFPSFKYSDDYADPLGFTGMFVGIACHDVSGRRSPADFDYLTYREFV